MQKQPTILSWEDLMVSPKEDIKQDEEEERRLGNSPLTSKTMLWDGGEGVSPLWSRGQQAQFAVVNT